MNSPHVGGWITKNLLSLPKGGRISFSRCEIRQHVEPPAGYTPADWILENIVGSAWEFIDRVEDKSGDVIFDRLENQLPDDGSRTYVSPDRRYLYDRDIRGIYQLKQATH